jgi:hypothetical protein
MSGRPKVSARILKTWALLSNPWVFFCFVLILGFELRAYTLSHSTNPFFMMAIVEIGS